MDGQLMLVLRDGAWTVFGYDVALDDGSAVEAEVVVVNRRSVAPRSHPCGGAGARVAPRPRLGRAPDDAPPHKGGERAKPSTSPRTWCGSWSWGRTPVRARTSSPATPTPSTSSGSTSRHAAPSDLGIPRDFWVELPDGFARINEALAQGDRSSPRPWSRTWSASSRTTWSIAGFDGFRDLVDVVGGVTVRAKEPVRDDRLDVDIRRGTNDLDGDRDPQLRAHPRRSRVTTSPAPPTSSRSCWAS